MDTKLKNCPKERKQCNHLLMEGNEMTGGTMND